MLTFPLGFYFSAHPTDRYTVSVDRLSLAGCLNRIIMNECIRYDKIRHLLPYVLLSGIIQTTVWQEEEYEWECCIHTCKIVRN